MLKPAGFIILLFFLFGGANAQPVSRPRVAVVLSGGGAKGFAHIGVLKVLEEEGIPIDMIVGTSMGGIVGGLYSIGYTADQIAAMSLTENWGHLLSDNVPRNQLDQYTKMEQQRYVLTMPISNNNKKPGLPTGMVNGQNVLNLFCGLAGNVPENANFSSFPIPFACIGTDLVNGEEIVLNSGFLPTAMFSTMTIPGAFVPGKHQGHLLVDGGIVNNFPTDVAKHMGADIIIGVEVSTDMHSADDINTITDLTDQLINFYTLRKDSANNRLCDILIKPNIYGYSTTSFNTQAVDTLIRRGKEATYAMVDTIRALKKMYNLQPKTISVAYTQPVKWAITEISFTGGYSIPERLLLDVFKLQIPGVYTYQDIKRSINNLYGMGVFKRVYFYLSDNMQGKTLHITIDEDQAWNLNVGMRINSRSNISVILNSTRKDYRKTFGLLSFTADISSNPRFNFLTEVDRENLPKVAFSLDGSYTNLTAHLNKDYSYPAEIYSASAKLYTYHRIFRNSILGAGIEQDYYIGKLYNIVSDSNLSVSASDKIITQLYGYYSFDNLDDYYFPTRGMETYAELSMAQDMAFKSINPVAYLRMKDYIPLNNRINLQLNLYARSVLRETTPIYLGNFLASRDYEISFAHHLPFYGLPTLWSAERTAFIGSAGLRARLYRKHYITLSTNYLLHNNDIHHLDEYKDILGFGFTYAYKSAVGPIEFTLGYSDAYSKTILSVNAGFWF